MTTNFKTVGDSYLDRNTLWDIAFLNGFLKYTNNKHENWTLNSTAYYRNSTVKPNTIDHIIKASQNFSGQQVGFYRPNQLSGIETQINYKPGTQILLIGGIIGEIENISERFSVSYSNSQELKPPEPSKPPMLNNQLFSYYLQLGYQISGNLNFTGGMRHDISSYYGQVVTPRLGLLYNIRKFTAKALYNKAFRSPKPWDYKYGTGNEDLNPEKMHSFELSVSYQLMKKLLLGSSLYHNQIKDKLTKETTATVDRWINKDKLNTTGIDLFGNYTTSNISIYANYTFNNSRDQDKIAVPEISKHTANAGITYSYSPNIKLNFRVNYIGERKNLFVIPTTGDDLIDDALLFNGCISFVDIKGFDLHLKVNNIFNTKYYHPSNRFAGRYRQPQQSYAIKFAYNF